VIHRFSSHSSVLSHLVYQNGWMCGAEIGVFEAQNLRALLMNCPHLHMIAVDQWEPHGGPRIWHDAAWNAPMKQIEARARYRLSFFGERVDIRKGASVEVAKTVNDASLDFVFIDGDHSEDGVVADVKAWLPKLRAGGMLTGHDIAMPTVQAGLQRSGVEWEVLPGDVWIAIG
jgi:hypothetical protein